MPLEPVAMDFDDLTVLSPEPAPARSGTPEPPRAPLAVGTQAGAPVPVIEFEQYTPSAQTRPRIPLAPSPSPVGTIGQAIIAPQYREAQHITWREMCRTQWQLLDGRANASYCLARRRMPIDERRIPTLAELDRLVNARADWHIVRSEGYVPSKDFLRLLDAGLFPCIDLLRNERDILYTNEPDMFHDVMGHMAMLADPTMSEYYRLFGRVGRKLRHPEQLDAVGKFYWFTVEFGLVNPTIFTDDHDPSQTRAYGAALLTGLDELVNTLAAGVAKLPFDVDDVLNSATDVHTPNEKVFVVPSIETAVARFYDWAKDEALL